MRYASLIGGALSGTGLMVVSLWYWHRAPDVAGQAGATNANLAIYSIRFAAVAGISAAQVLLMTRVVAMIYHPCIFDEIIWRAAGLISTVSLVAAVAFALMAR